MNWSGGALKATVGSGGRCAMIAWLELQHPGKVADPGIGFWLWISGAFLPLTRAGQAALRRVLSLSELACVSAQSLR